MDKREPSINANGKLYAPRKILPTSCQSSIP